MPKRKKTELAKICINCNSKKKHVNCTKVNQKPTLQILQKDFKLIPADKKKRFFAMLFLYIIVVIDPTVSNPKRMSKSGSAKTTARKRVLNSENWIMPLFNPAEGRCPTQNIDHA